MMSPGDRTCKKSELRKRGQTNTAEILKCFEEMLKEGSASALTLENCKLQYK
ncbi:hypothetical protein DCAR_0207079 [Daucus carota subsp. sativus]|uniref:Uncharacterized protein n=1 Tax=Daucus carota subsp. sativus TaxID=79200 RepID=A0A166DMP5_DAUCS|nr:hypothetical protein DCAR_0207079 [Daucus carota subsp. sativus]